MKCKFCFKKELLGWHSEGVEPSLGSESVDWDEDRKLGYAQFDIPPERERDWQDYVREFQDQIFEECRRTFAAERERQKLSTTWHPSLPELV